MLESDGTDRSGTVDGGDESLSLRSAGVQDIPALAALAGRIWRAHYPSIIGQDQTEAMLAVLYAADALAAQMAAGQHYLLLVRGDQQAIGFGAWSLNAHGLGGPGVTRLYLDQAWQGRGLGRHLLQSLLAALTAAGATQARLRVNRRNIQAINFYFRHGFIIERSLDELFAEHWLLDDYVMVREISGCHLSP